MHCSHRHFCANIHRFACNGEKLKAKMYLKRKQINKYLYTNLMENYLARKRFEYIQ